MIRKETWYVSAWSIMSRQVEKRKPERDGARRGREIFQQKNTRDRFSHRPLFKIFLLLVKNLEV
jgi:hypothetical protein